LALFDVIYYAYGVCGVPINVGLCFLRIGAKSWEEAKKADGNDGYD
jgi:hypothetical protein